MRLFGRPSFASFRIAFTPGLIALATACSVYEVDPSERVRAGGTAGSGGSTAAGGAAGSGGTGGNATGGNTSGGGGTSGGTGGSGGAGGTMSTDAGTETDSSSPDGSLPTTDARGDGVGGGYNTDTGADAYPPYDIAIDDASDAPIGTDADDGGTPPGDAPNDNAVDASPPPDADASAPDATSDKIDVVDSGPTGPQILPKHGTPIENADAGGPFDSRCASDEVVTGFIGRAGVQTDAIASTCSKLIGGALSSPRNLPLNGNATGGSAFTVTCPANYVAVSIVGRYGHNTMWNEDVTTAIGVICKNLTSSATQTVSITGQPALDSGYTTFREDCTGGRYLTDISGRIDGNSLGITVGQVGGECDFR